MNIIEVHKEIERLSPAAARVASQLVGEINRLNEQDSEKNQRIMELRGQVEQQAADLQQSAESHSALVRQTNADRAYTLGELLRIVEPNREVAVPQTHAEYRMALRAALNRYNDFYEALDARAEGKMQALNQCANEAQMAMGRKNSGPRPASPIQFWDWTLKEIRDLLESYKAGSEALANALRHNKEMKEAQNTADHEPPYDLTAIQLQAQSLSEALNRTHSAYVEMSELLVRSREKQQKQRRDLRKALADIEFWRGCHEDSENRLHLVDMALRGQALSVAAVAPYHTSTLDLAIRTHESMVSYRDTAERETNWRQQLEGELGRCKESEKDAWLQLEERVNESGALSEGVAPQVRVEPPTFDLSPLGNKQVAACGQPFPCEHAPDGGNHPAIPGDLR